jgi:Condensation domain
MSNTSKPAVITAPLTLEQQWFISRRITSGGARMSVTRSYDLNGPLDITRFLASARSVIARHQGMRARIGIDGGGDANLVIQPPGDDIPLICQAVACRSREQFEAYARSSATADMGARWNPVREPMYRLRLLRRSEDEHILLGTFDHIGFDDRAVELFFRYLWREYAGGLSDASGEDDIDLVTAVRQELERYGRRAATANSRYWLARYALAPARWVPTGAGAMDEGRRREGTDLDLSPEELAEVRSTATEHGASAFEACICVFAWTAFGLTRQERAAIYIPLDNRGPDHKGVIGNFACVRPLVLDRRDGPAAGYLEQARTEVFRALAHRHLAADSERLAELAQLAAARSSTAHRSLGVNYIRADAAETGDTISSGLTVRRAGYAPVPPAAVPTLGLIVRDSPDNMRLSLLYTMSTLDAGQARAQLRACADALRTFGLRHPAAGGDAGRVASSATGQISAAGRPADPPSPAPTVHTYFRNRSCQ